MKPPDGQKRIVFTLPTPEWEAMKQSMLAYDLPHGNWLRAAVREKLRRDEEEYDE